MKFSVFHAEHRCEPCREMHQRIDTALIQFANKTGLDATSFIEFVDVDECPDKAPEHLTVVPHLQVTDPTGFVSFEHSGRITIEQVFAVLEGIAEYEELPEYRSEFSPDAPSAPVVFYRTYSRRNKDGSRETYQQMIERCVDDIVDLGNMGADDDALVRSMAEKQHALPSGRWLWTGGTDWIQKKKNYSGAYNCTNTTVNHPEVFGLMMELAMMGSGTGAILERDQVWKLPRVHNAIQIEGITKIGNRQTGGHPDTTWDTSLPSGVIQLRVGDSRMGWVTAYQKLINWAFFGCANHNGTIRVQISLEEIRGPGAPLKGFGGTANPVRLPVLFNKVADLLSAAQGRKLTPLECCLLIDEAAACVVAGNIRRSAGMRQFSADDKEAATAKLGLYQQDAEGNWRVDPVRENLRMANHTRCFHRKPTFDEVKEAVTLQVESGEGAIQYVPEAIARANVDLLSTESVRQQFLSLYENGLEGSNIQPGKEAAAYYFHTLDPSASVDEINHRVMRYGLNPCGEIIGEDFHCNLAEVHLNTIDPFDVKLQEDAFRAAALEVAALLYHQFKDDRYSFSRHIDPIVGVSFTGLFDFFMNKWGVDWLQWMFMDRPPMHPANYAQQEADILRHWRMIVEATISEFCESRGLRTPNRMTTVQPAGTKSLLTGASSGWHPPKAQRFIRRITFGANDPVALAAIDAGFSVVPAPSSRDDEGNLLNDINDERVSEWLVEIPTQVSWADLDGADNFDLAKLSAVSQFKLWMNVQQNYTAHNTSATIELTADEIDDLSHCIFDAIDDDEGYISAALLQRFDASGGTFPRLPFEPIDRETYQRLTAEVENRKKMDFASALAMHDDGRNLSPEDSACSSPACLAKAERPNGNPS